MTGDAEAFRRHAVRFWECLDEADSTAANAETDAADAVVKRLEDQGQADAVLRPFLHDSDERVQYAAAAYLVKRNDQEAVAVLNRLAESPSGLVAPSARLLVMRHGG